MVTFPLPFCIFWGLWRSLSVRSPAPFTVTVGSGLVPDHVAGLSRIKPDEAFPGFCPGLVCGAPSWQKDCIRPGYWSFSAVFNFIHDHVITDILATVQKKVGPSRCSNFRPTKPDGPGLYLDTVTRITGLCTGLSIFSRWNPFHQL